MKYASQTTVPVSRSRAEIEELVLRYGADQFGSAIDEAGRRAMIQFRIRRGDSGLLVRFQLPLPDRRDKKFTHYHPGGSRYSETPRTEAAAREHYEQACRQRWRALLLAIKAKLEAVECGITTFEEEFLAHIVMPNGETVGEHFMPQVAALMAGQMPTLLEGPR